MSETDEDIQIRELDVLQSIYTSEELIVDREGWSQINVNLFDNKSLALKLNFQLPAKYPSEEAPALLLQASFLRKLEIDLLKDKLRYIYEEKKDAILYEWIEFLRNDSASFLECCEIDLLQRITSVPQVSKLSLAKNTDKQLCPLIKSGQSICDRKSKFVAHIAAVSHPDQVNTVLECLKENKRIAEATHNIVAYRIRLESGELISQRDDDGEAGAGDKLLFLLEKGGIENYCVVVTRWFGGIHLGNARFKHINDCALEIFKKEGFFQ